MGVKSTAKKGVKKKESAAKIASDISENEQIKIQCTNYLKQEQEALLRKEKNAEEIIHQPHEYESNDALNDSWFLDNCLIIGLI